jgi:SAM-dependent methyltransferase
MTATNSQRDYWNGEAGEHWSRFHQRYDELLDGFGRAVIDRVDPKPGERFVDIGCGAGATTFAVGRRVGPAGSVLGVDLSGPLLEIASQRSSNEQITNVLFVKADAASYRFEPGSVDGVVSRFGVMFFDDPVRAFGQVGHALCPGGRLTFVCWQEVLANEWVTVPGAAIVQHLPMPQLDDPGAPGLFALADADLVRSMLKQAGFGHIEIEPLVLPQRFDDNSDDAISFMLQTQIAARMLAGANPQQVDAVVSSVRAALETHARGDGVYLDGAAWLVTARAHS